MKNKKIMSIILAAGMILSTMSMAVSARANGNYLGEDQVDIMNNDSMVGIGYFDFGTTDEPGAYASTESISSLYRGTAIDLVSGSYSDRSHLDSGSVSAYIAYRTSLSGRSVDCTWTVYRPDSTGSIPSGSPDASNSYTWWDY